MKARQVARGRAQESSAASARCPRCGAPFRCGIDDAGGCWCAKLPPLPSGALAAGTGCLCEKCLRDELAGAGQPRSL